jgi:hypothetical protein
MKIEKPTVLLKRNHYIKCFCFNQNVANKNTNSAESFHNKATFERCWLSVWTISLLLHDLPFEE